MMKKPNPESDREEKDNIIYISEIHHYTEDDIDDINSQREYKIPDETPENGLIGFISDTHGDYDVLSAVIEKLESYGVKKIYHLGGIFSSTDLSEGDRKSLALLVEKTFYGDTGIIPGAGEIESELAWKRFEYGLHPSQTAYLVFACSLRTLADGESHRAYTIGYSSIHGNPDSSHYISAFDDLQIDFRGVERVQRHSDTLRTKLFVRGFSDFDGLFCKEGHRIVGVNEDETGTINIPDNHKDKILVVGALNKPEKKRFAILNTKERQIRFVEL